MAWGVAKVNKAKLDEVRVQFVVEANLGQHNHAELCRKYDISRPTGYSWVKRFGSGGIREVVEQSRRPHHSPRESSPDLVSRVIAARRLRPDWGARKLGVMLEQEGLAVPKSTIHRILLRNDMVREENRHPMATKRFERSNPNELWQMDFKGPTGWDSPVGPLAVLDDHSRYSLLLHQTGSTRAEGVQEQLQGLFQEAGLPEAMLMDHGTPWWNAQAANGWTWLTVWLMRLGIRLTFSRYRHPQTQGKVERFNGTLGRAIRERGLPPSEHRQAWLDAFRQEYNHWRPHEALDMQVPASRWKCSSRRYDPRPGNWEYPAGSELRQVTDAGNICYAGRQWPISRSLAGETVQLRPMGEDRRVLVFFCKTAVRELNLETAESLAVAKLMSQSQPGADHKPSDLPGQKHNV